MTCSTSCFNKTPVALALVALLMLSGCSSSRGKPGDPIANAVDPNDGAGARIAVFPIDNLTGRQVPVDVVDGLLRTILTERGLRLVEGESMEDFMREYRIRNTSGVNSRVSRQLEEEMGASALLLTSLEILQDEAPPRIAMFSRLVSTGERPRILWMDGVGMAGDEFPGLLGIGRIEDPDLILERAAECIVDSLVKTLPEMMESNPASRRSGASDCGPRGEVEFRSDDATVKRRHRPEMSFRSPAIDPDRQYNVAVVPFVNLSDRKNAGRIVALHFVNQMSRSGTLTVIEPGIVEEQLLKYRIIMEAGPSLENAKVLASDESVGVDLVFSGSVFDYQDAFGIPKVDFSVTLIEKDDLRVVWSARSHATGDDNVFFFGQTRIHTAHRVAAEMARGTLETLNR